MKISVALVSYNKEKYISEQIDTILLNMEKEDELIISDDGSTDKTIEIIQSYIEKDSRIKFFQIQHSGCNANYENAIKHCSGDIIVLSDDDNVWLPNKLAFTRKHFIEDEKLTMLMHNCEVVDENLNLIHPSFMEYNNSKKGLWHNFVKSSYGGSLIAFRSSMRKYLLPFPKKMPFFYDDWIGLINEKHGKVLFVQDILSKWRRYKGANSTQFINTDGSVTTKKKKNKHFFKNNWQRIKVRAVKLFYIIFK